MNWRTLYGRKGRASEGIIRSLGPAAWFRPKIGITITGSGVAVWADQSGNGRDLLQGTDTNRPAYNSTTGEITFDGADNFLKTAPFTLNQPETVYLVFKFISWANNKYFIDGNAGGSMGVLTRAVGGSAPDVQLYAGANLSSHAGPAVGSYGVLTALFNGASSLLQTNATTALTGDAGSSNAGAITLGASADAAVFANVIVKEVLIFAAAHNASQRALVQNYLAARHGIVL